MSKTLTGLSQIFILLGAAFATQLSLSGGGHHWAGLTQAQRVNVYFWYWIWTMPGGFVLSVPNMAVVSLLCRLFKPRRWHKIFLWASAILCTVNFVLVSVLTLFWCRPFKVPWDRVDAGQNECRNTWVYVKFCLYASGEYHPTVLHTNAQMFLTGLYDSLLGGCRLVLGCIPSVRPVPARLAS